MQLEPAFSIIKKFGGAKAVAEITGRDVSRVYRWTWPVEKGGTNGLIPNRAAIKLLAEAPRRGVAVTADEFLPAD